MSGAEQGVGVGSQDLLGILMGHIFFLGRANSHFFLEIENCKRYVTKTRVFFSFFNSKSGLEIG